MLGKAAKDGLIAGLAGAPGSGLGPGPALVAVDGSSVSSRPVVYLASGVIY